MPFNNLIGYIYDFVYHVVMYAAMILQKINMALKTPDYLSFCSQVVAYADQNPNKTPIRIMRAQVGYDWLAVEW